MKGIIDRFEGESAVILVEAENRELLVPKKELPSDCKVKSAVIVEESAGKQNPVIQLDPETDQKNKQVSSNLREALLNRKKNSKLKKKK
ncbi:DUF3006 domain-containing protein [Oceanobacillus sp. M60]